MRTQTWDWRGVIFISFLIYTAAGCCHGEETDGLQCDQENPGWRNTGGDGREGGLESSPGCETKKITQVTSLRIIKQNITFNLLPSSYTMWTEQCNNNCAWRVSASDPSLKIILRGWQTDPNTKTSILQCPLAIPALLTELVGTKLFWTDPTNGFFSFTLIHQSGKQQSKHSTRKKDFTFSVIFSGPLCLGRECYRAPLPLT